MSKPLIVIPTYNEVENLSSLIPKIFDNLPNAHILVVDDNSPDGTGELSDRWSEEDDRVFCLHRQEKSGLGRGLLGRF